MFFFIKSQESVILSSLLSELEDNKNSLLLEKIRKIVLSKEETVSSCKCVYHNVPLVKKIGKHGYFLGCPLFPNCRYSKDI